MSHQYLIATKVDIHVLCPQAETAGEDGWTKLGHFVFESNQESDFAARELKTVKIDRMMTTQVKLSFWRGHVNKHNIYNQVGVVSVNLIGWPEDGMVPESEVPRLRGRRDESSFAGPTVLNNVGVAAARHHRGEGGRGGEENYAVMESTSKAGLNVGSAELVSLALEAGIDPFVMHIIREAHKHKHKAVVREDYEEARRLRDGIERLKMIGVRVAELEGKKQKAVENEDYESAHVLKLDIDKLRQSCVCECCPPPKMPPFRHPSPTKRIRRRLRVLVTDLTTFLSLSLSPWQLWASAACRALPLPRSSATRKGRRP